jgi:hypothetical protein
MRLSVDYGRHIVGWLLALVLLLLLLLFGEAEAGQFHALDAIQCTKFATQGRCVRIEITQVHKTIWNWKRTDCNQRVTIPTHAHRSAR